MFCRPSYSYENPYWSTPEAPIEAAVRRAARGAVVVAELDIARVREERQNFDPSGHYRAGQTPASKRVRPRTSDLFGIEPLGRPMNPRRCVSSAKAVIYLGAMNGSNDTATAGLNGDSSLLGRCEPYGNQTETNQPRGCWRAAGGYWRIDRQ